MERDARTSLARRRAQAALAGVEPRGPAALVGAAEHGPRTRKCLLLIVGGLQIKMAAAPASWWPGDDLSMVERQLLSVLVGKSPRCCYRPPVRR